MVFLSVVFGMLGSGRSTEEIRFTLEPTYAYDEPLESYRLKQVYFVTSFTTADLDRNTSLKKELD